MLEGVVDGDTLGVPVTVGVAVSLGDGVIVWEGVAVFDGDGVGEVDAEGVDVTLATADGVVLGVGLGLTPGPPQVAVGYGVVVTAGTALRASFPTTDILCMMCRSGSQCGSSSGLPHMRGCTAAHVRSFSW